MRFRVLAIAMLLAPSLTFTAASAEAEWFVDLYAGGAFTQKDDVKFDKVGAPAIGLPRCPMSALGWMFRIFGLILAPRRSTPPSSGFPVQ